MVGAMHKEWRQLAAPHERLVWARRRAGHESAAAAAEAMAISKPTYFGHENGSRGITVNAGERYATFFRVSFDWLMRGEGAPTSAEQSRISKLRRSEAYVPIVGRVGAGPEGSIEFSAAQEPLGEAERPPGWTESMVAVEVQGNSMRPIASDGWLVYYDKRSGGLTPDMIGQPCVLWLESGHAVVKVPYPGSKRGLYNLESANPAVETMRDMRVKAAALVTAFVPGVAARRLAKDARGTASH
jgi:SOS-response transcriptional repressor LexA